MNHLKIIIILLISSLFIFACSATKYIRRKPPFKFEGITLSKKIDIEDTVAVPQEPTTTFSIEDREVIAHLKLQNLSGKHTLRWNWYDPAGYLYYTTGDFPIIISPGKYLREITAWHRLSIQDNKASDYPGQWQVRVFLDGELMEYTSFILKPLTDISQLPENSQKLNHKNWGLIIGIENYAHLPSVNYARKDAMIVKEYFIKILGVPEENILSLIDDEATKARIEEYFKDYIPYYVDEDTILYVYYVGHGAPEKEKGELYLFPYDSDTRFITKTAYRLKSFYQNLDNLKVEKVFVYLDSCFSGVAARGSEMLAKDIWPALVYVDDINLHSDDIVSMIASSSGQMSHSYPETNHGLFTYFFLKGLMGEADSDEDHWISVTEIFNYVKTHVTRVSRKMGTKQTPVIIPSLDMLKDMAVSKVLN